METGDLGAPDEEAGGWRLEGRASEVFKRYGEKVALPPLLRRVDKVWEAGCAAYRDRDSQGEEGWVLVLAGPADKSAARRLLGEYRGTSRIHWPLRVECLPELPLLPNGKPDNETLCRHPERETLWSQPI